MRRFAKLLGRSGLAMVVLSTLSAHGLDLVGYLPTYRMGSGYVNNVLPDQLRMLDEVRYFGLTVDSAGEIVPLSGSMQTQLNNLATVQGIIDSLPAAERPRLGITLGGASQDATFTAVAADPAKRTTLATNIDTLLTQTGAAGVDIDWEHPNAGIERTSHYPALLTRIKQQVGEDHLVYATVAPSVVISNSVFSGPDAIDGVSLMTYDMGWWSNDPSNPNNGEHALQADIDTAVAAWTEPSGSPNDRPWVFGAWGNATPAERIGVGLPFYGRSLSNQSAFTYAELVAGGVTTDGEYYQYAGQQVWSPSPGVAAQRVESAIEQGLQHLIIWEIAQDLPATSQDSLLRAAYEAREALAGLPGDFNGDGAVNAADYTQWRDRGDADLAPGDYAVWASNYGATASPQALAVPEPGGLLIALLAGLVARPSARGSDRSRAIG